MGEPATPTPADRAVTRKLAADIVQGVVDDKAMPLDLHATPSGMVARWEVEMLAFQLAQEITLLRTELEEAISWWESHLDGLEKRLVGGPDGGTRTERALIAEMRGKP